MERTTEAIVDFARQQAPHTEKVSPSSGDFERLFQMLDDLGPAPDEFMLNVCDPLLHAEDIFGPEESW
jgi:hypothetical protein